MRTRRVIGTPHAGIAAHARVASLREAAQRAARESHVEQSRRSARELRSLEAALASSRQETHAAQHRVEALARVNAELEARAGRVERPDLPLVPHRSLPDLWSSAGLDPEGTGGPPDLPEVPWKLRKGEVLYRAGDTFNGLYAIRAGSCKTDLVASDGRDQVAGYHMTGETVGIDGIYTGVHQCRATALEDMRVYAMPFAGIEQLMRKSDLLRHNLQMLLAGECDRARSLLIMLGTMRSEQRLATFLIELAERYEARGFSPSQFVLRMTRREIGSYLGLKLETVSRVFSRFQRAGLIEVRGRAVKFLDPEAVGRLARSGT